MGKTQKVKAVGSTILPFCILSFIPTKTNYAGLLWMQFKVKPRKAFPQCWLYVLNIVLAQKIHNTPPLASQTDVPYIAIDKSSMPIVDLLRYHGAEEID